MLVWAKIFCFVRQYANEEAFENILVWSGPYKEVKSSKYDVMVNYFESNFRYNGLSLVNLIC